MKFIKDPSLYEIKTKNGFDVVILDENFRYSTSEYILCKVKCMSRLGHELLILYTPLGGAIHCFNMTLTSDEVDSYGIQFIERHNWYNVRVGVGGYLESSKPYKTYEEAISNRMNNEEYTIQLINDRKSMDSIPKDELDNEELDNLLIDIVTNEWNTNPIDPNKNDVIFNKLVKNKFSDLEMNLFYLGYYSSNLDDPQVKRSIYFSFMISYPELHEFMNNRDELKSEYIKLRYNGKK